MCITSGLWQWKSTWTLQCSSPFLYGCRRSSLFREKNKRVKAAWIAEPLLENRCPEEPSRFTDDFALARNKHLSPKKLVLQLFIAINLAYPNMQPNRAIQMFNNREMVGIVFHNYLMKYYVAIEKNCHKTINNIKNYYIINWKKTQKPKISLER